MRSMSTATEQTWTKSGIVTLMQKRQHNIISFVWAQYKSPYTRVNPDIVGLLLV